MSIATSTRAARGDLVRVTGREPRRTFQNFTVTGVRNVEFIWKDPRHFKGSSGEGHAHYTDAGVHLNRGRPPAIDQYVVLHELGHAIGRGHSDTGIMDYGHPDIGPGTVPSETTLEIARSFDGFRVITFSSGDMRYMVKEWVMNRLEPEQFRWFQRKWAEDDPAPQIYFASDWGMYGNSPGTVSHVGKFYGHPVRLSQLYGQG